jgi:hypothetical protein
MLGSERSNSAPTDAKRPVGVISLIGDYGGTPSQKYSSILAGNRVLASSEYRGAEDKDDQSRHENVGCIDVKVGDGEAHRPMPPPASARDGGTGAETRRGRSRKRLLFERDLDQRTRSMTCDVRGWKQLPDVGCDTAQRLFPWDNLSQKLPCLTYGVQSKPVTEITVSHLRGAVHWLHPGIPSAGQQAYDDQLLKDNKFVAVPSAVSTHSWNFIFIGSTATGAYKQRFQERLAVDTRLHPPI